MLKYLLDTNIVIYVLKKRPIETLNTFNKQHGRMAISAITLAELVHGAEKSQLPAKNLSTIEDFCSRLKVLPQGLVLVSNNLREFERVPGLLLENWVA